LSAPAGSHKLDPLGRQYRAEQYPGLLTADPPVCAVGQALSVLRRCDRIRRGEGCFCRVYSADVAEDLIAAGAVGQAEYLSASLGPEDVEALLDELQAFGFDRVADDDLRARVETLTAQLARLVRHGSGLTDRYSDELD
jgi:hypothetical protein